MSPWLGGEGKLVRQYSRRVCYLYGASWPSPRSPSSAGIRRIFRILRPPVGRRRPCPRSGPDHHSRCRCRSRTLLVTTVRQSPLFARHDWLPFRWFDLHLRWFTRYVRVFWFGSPPPHPSCIGLYYYWYFSGGLRFPLNFLWCFYRIQKRHSLDVRQ